MTRNNEKRINEAADRLMRSPLSRSGQRRHDDAYVRSTKALDPDTHLATQDRPSRVKRSA
jgi:hypothetical protein